MNNELAGLDLHTLKQMYEQEMNGLNASLLAGADWKEVAQLRKRLVEISIAIDKAELHRYPRQFYDTNEAGKP